MCGTCTTLAEASTAPMAYAAGIAAVATAGWSRVRGRHLRPEEPDESSAATDGPDHDLVGSASGT